MAATRRSPRTIEAFLNNNHVPGLTAEQSTLLYSLAHCTSWSAERISHKLQELTSFMLAPESIWEHYKRWIESRPTGETMTLMEIDIMKCVLVNKAQLAWQGIQRPLGRTSRPVNVEFAKRWCPKDGTPLFEGYTMGIRQCGKEFWLGQTNFAAVGKLNPFEEPLVERFGHYITLLIRDLLKRWSRALKAKLQAEPLLSSINTHYHGYVALIFNYLKHFQEGYEDLYGKLDEPRGGSSLGEMSSESRVTILNTGYGIKVFLGIMMADRLWVVDYKRKKQAEDIAFIEMAMTDVPEGLDDCPVCQDKMGVPNPEGRLEHPLKMVVCCGQIIGKECLRTWLSETNTCPICRHVLKATFMHKLFEYNGDEEILGTEDVKDEEVLAEQLADAAATPVSTGLEVPGQQGEMLSSIAVRHDIVLDDDEFEMEE